MAIARKFGALVYKWDVSELRRAASDLPVFSATVDWFDLDVDAWFGEACKPTIKNVIHHMRAIRDADLYDPILLSAEGHVFDGLHRLAKCVLNGIATVNCRQFSVNPPPIEVIAFEEFQRQKPMIAETLVWMEENGL